MTRPADSAPQSAASDSDRSIQVASATTSAHPVRNSPSSSHSTRCVPPGDDDLHVARGAAVAMRGDGRRAGAGARSFGRTDATLPDQNADAIRRLDLGELDVRPFRKMRVDRQRRGRPNAAAPR